MSLIDFAKNIRAAWDELFKSEPKVNPFVVHMEQEIAQLQADKSRLEGKCEMLQLKLEIALAPKVDEVKPQVPRTIPKVAPAPTTSWEAYKAEYIREQEAEEAREKELAQAR